MLHGRMLVCAWESGLEEVSDPAVKLIMKSVENQLKNILSLVISSRKGYKLRDGKLKYAMGSKRPNPYLRQSQMVSNESTESDLTWVMEGGQHVPSFKPHTELAESMAAREMSLSSHREASLASHPGSSAPISLFDLLYSMQLYRSSISSHSVYAPAVERIIHKLCHPGHEEINQDVIHQQEISIKQTLSNSNSGSANPDLLPEVTLGQGAHMEYPDGSVPMVAKTNNGRMSPVRARTVKEYDLQISELKKENFNLKLRIYFLEERMQQKFGDGEDVFKTNIELKVEVETLKRELSDKQDLLKKASTAMECISSGKEAEIQQLRQQLEKDTSAARSSVQEQLESALNDKDSLEKERDSLLDDLDGVKKALDDANKDLGKLNDEIGKLKDLISEIERDRDIQIQGMKKELAANQEENSRLCRTNADMNKRLEELSEENRRLQEEGEEQGRQREKTDRHVQDEAEEQKKKLGDLEEKLLKLHVTIETKDDILGKLEALLKERDSERKKLSEKVKDLEEDVQQLEDRKLVRDRTIKGLHDVVRDRENKIDALKKQLKSKEDELNKQKKDTQTLTLKKSSELEKKLEEMAYLDDKVSCMEVQLKERQKDIEVKYHLFPSLNLIYS
ncbi:hypothetical protein FSP39_009258 [Pinctada imbricata]|uniref:Centrosomin N-terminal motif 1 domain-containing protein n=1 Tax=Pinctada imbricata TaxID=66713 RepID=A0AA88XKX3_PINIB|nr:hypothetical protein FSP39_009258 [Pinctada imbricata]